MSDTKQPVEAQPGKPDNPIEILMRAEKGDDSTLPSLRKILDDNGDLVELAGNLAAKAQDAIIISAGGKNVLLKEAVSRKLNQLRQELSGADATPLERLLIDRIALCWLALHEAEIRFAQSKDLSFRQIEHWQNRIDRAHRRYLSAIKALAMVRKLGATVLQVNIARRQTNIASSCPTVNGEVKNL